MKDKKRIWLKTFISLLILLPGLPLLFFIFTVVLSLMGKSSEAITLVVNAMNYYYALPLMLFGHALYPMGDWGINPTADGFMVGAALYGIIAFGLSFPISMGIKHIKTVMEESQPAAWGYCLEDSAKSSTATLCKEMEKRISIQWYDPRGMGFWLRSIKPDGSYYGELEYAHDDPLRRAGTTVEGKITDDDWVRCQPLLAQFTKPISAKRQQWVGQLASWTTNFATPDILFQYEPGDENDLQAAQAFLELKTIVQKSLSGQAVALVEFSKKTHNQRPNRTVAPR